MTSNSKILTKSSILRTIYFFANVLVAFLLMPFVIHSLGDRMYGLWIVAGSLLGYYWLIDFGISIAVERYISRGVGRNDQQEINAVANTALLIYTIGGLLALMVSLILAYLSPLVIENAGDVTTVRLILIILGISFAVNFPMRIFSGILRAYLRYDLITMLGFGILVIRSLLIFYFLYTGHGVVALAGITLATDIINRIGLCILARRICPNLVISARFIHKSKIKELVHYGGYAFLSQVAKQMQFNLDNMVIVIFLGLSPVTIYSIASRLTTYFRKFIGTSLGIMMPLFSQYEGRGDYQSIREKFIFITKINGYMAMLIGSMLIIFGQKFIQRWMGPEYSYSYIILIVLCSAMMIGLMQRQIMDLLRGISRHKFYALVEMGEGIANLVLSLIFVKMFGLIGVAIGTAIPMLIATLIILPRYACRAIDLNVNRYYRECIWGVITRSALIIGVPYLFYRDMIQANYLNITTLATIHSLIFTIFVFFFGFNKSEIVLVKKVLHSFRKTEPSNKQEAAMSAIQQDE